MLYQTNVIRIGFKYDSGRLNTGLRIDWNNYGTRYVGLFFRGRSFLDLMTWRDGAKIATIGRARFVKFNGRWRRDERVSI
jgi:hypothetical protein